MGLASSAHTLHATAAQWRDQDASVLNDPPAASPNRPIHIVDYTDKYHFHIPELEPPSYF